MEFKGTKGKWEVENINEPSKGKYKALEINLSAGNINSFITVWAYNYDRVDIEAKANAQLISCAPEMLEMLEKLSTNYSLTPSERQNIKDVIKKATEI